MTPQYCDIQQVINSVVLIADLIPFCMKTLYVITVRNFRMGPNGLVSSNSLDSYFGGARIEFRQGYWLSKTEVFIVSSVPLARFQEFISIRSGPLVSRSFPIHQSSCHSTLYNADIMTVTSCNPPEKKRHFVS
jgi:hypothetical protein